MKSTAILLSIAALTGATSTAAESFTSTYKSDPTTVITAPGPTPAQSMAGAYWKGVTTTTFKNGSTATASYTCIGWATPGQATTNSAVCEGVETARDRYAIQLVCAATDLTNPNASATCWGALIGTSGKYAGRTGSFTQMGDTVSGTGQGAWKD